MQCPFSISRLIDSSTTALPSWFQSYISVDQDNYYSLLERNEAAELLIESGQVSQGEQERSQVEKLLARLPPVVSLWTSKRVAALQPEQKKQWELICDEMGKLSMKAQNLKVPITTSIKFVGSSDRIYLLVDRVMNEIVGLIRMGEKRLFIRDEVGNMKEITPTCVLDFYLHESRQRQGLGIVLFRYMLACESSLQNLSHLLDPCKLAYDRPSEKLLAFLKKHYHLSKFTPQSNAFVVFKKYFETANPVIHKASQGQPQFLFHPTERQHTAAPASMDTPTLLNNYQSQYNLPNQAAAHPARGNNEEKNNQFDTSPSSSSSSIYSSSATANKSQFRDDPNYYYDRSRSPPGHNYDTSSSTNPYTSPSSNAQRHISSSSSTAQLHSRGTVSSSSSSSSSSPYISNNAQGTPSGPRTTFHRPRRSLVEEDEHPLQHYRRQSPLTRAGGLVLTAQTSQQINEKVDKILQDERSGQTQSRQSLQHSASSSSFTEQQPTTHQLQSSPSHLTQSGGSSSYDRQLTSSSSTRQLSSSGSSNTFPSDFAAQYKQVHARTPFALFPTVAPISSTARDAAAQGMGRNLRSTADYVNQPYQPPQQHSANQHMAYPSYQDYNAHTENTTPHPSKELSHIQQNIKKIEESLSSKESAIRAYDARAYNPASDYRQPDEHNLSWSRSAAYAKVQQEQYHQHQHQHQHQHIRPDNSSMYEDKRTEQQNMQVQQLHLQQQMPYYGRKKISYN